MSNWREWIAPLQFLGQSWLSLTGVVLVTTAAIFWLFLLPANINNPYASIVTTFALPGVFLLGLALIPIGIAVARRAGRLTETPNWRRLIIFVAVTTFVNLIVVSQTSYRAVEYMDGAEFCGAVCHVPMEPEYVAWKNAPHSKVDCARCHVGPGAGWFVKSKVQGTRRLLAMTTGHFPKPIPEPELRASKEICESCHTHRKSSADRLRVITHFADDEANTKSSTVLTMKIGKIHAAHPGDCYDCHNRPAHTMYTAEQEADRALAAKTIDPALPFARKRAVEALKAAASGPDAARRFESATGNAKGAAVVRTLFERNVFPAMKVTWGTYPNHLGHADDGPKPASGCFRCHDGKGLTQDCNTCHTLVAMGEKNPKVLADLGVEQ